MELEERVQRMEEDISILKNQIRNTLLDIQEQLATQYHPSLRAARLAAQPGSGSPGVRAADEGQGEAIPSVKVKKVTLAAPTTVSEDEDAAGADAGMAGRPAVQRSTAQAAVTERDDLRLMNALIRWTRTAVGTIGAAPTRRLLEGYAADGHLPARLVARVTDLAGLDSAPEMADEPPADGVLDMLVSLSEAIADASQRQEPDRG